VISRIAIYAGILLTVMLTSIVTEAARLKDIANIRGVRSNQLVGYGVVVGLAGTGDSKSEFTNKSIERMLDRLGVKVQGKEVSSKSVAAVIITALRAGPWCKLRCAPPISKSMPWLKVRSWSGIRAPAYTKPLHVCLTAR
jgi:hypothetical protein